MSEGIGLGEGAEEVGVDKGYLFDEASRIEAGKEEIPGAGGGADAEREHAVEGTEGFVNLAARQAGADESTEEEDIHRKL